MRLATYNVLANTYLRRDWYEQVPPRLLVPATRRAALLARIVGLSADVLCLQEVEEDCAADLTTALTPHGYAGLWQAKRGKRDGCATFFRGAALEAHDALFYPDGSGHLALLTWLAVGARRLLVVNTHLKWDDPAKPANERRCVGQAEALARQLAAVPGDAVVCGDLNVVAADPTIERLAAVGFRDVFAGADEPHTCCTNGRTQKIDHILARGSLEWSPVRTPSCRGATALPSDAEPSDHLPLAASLGS